MKNKEITIIKLLNDISKSEIVPKQIKYQGKVYTLYAEDKTYYDENYESLFQMYNFRILNDTVEILPEENDEWEDICELLDDSRYNFSNRQNGMTQEDRRLLDSNFKTLGETINQLIKNQKCLKERLDKNE